MSGSIAVPGRKLGLCVGCGSGDYVYDVGAYNLDRYCRACIKKAGAPQLQALSHRSMATAKRPVRTEKCLWCQGPSLAGSVCAGCRAKYRARFGKDVVT